MDDFLIEQQKSKESAILTQITEKEKQSDKDEKEVFLDNTLLNNINKDEKKQNTQNSNLSINER
jgi:hypothetical protein